MKKRVVGKLQKSDTKTSMENVTAANAETLMTANNDDLGDSAPVNINSLIPQARDGHISVVYSGKLFIMGGDRHNMPFNDLFMIDLADYFYFGW